MINSHFIDVLKTFNPQELEGFKTFLDSPYFNKRKKLVELFNVVKSYYPFFTDENFTRENIFKKIYKKEDFNYGKINEGLSALYKLSMNYIKQNAIEKNKLYPDVMLIEELRKRSLKNIFTIKDREIKSEINQFNELDSNLFLKQYLIEIERANYVILFGKNHRKERIDGYLNVMRNIMVSLTNFYISEIISLSVNNFNYSISYSSESGIIFEKIHKSGLIQSLFKIIEPFNQYDFYLRLLNYFFEAISDINNSNKYYEYKSAVFENLKKMSTDDINYHIQCLSSYCIIKKRHEKSAEEFSKEYVNLQEIILEKKLFIDSRSEFLHKDLYINLLTNYDSLKNKEKVKFLLQYSKYLHPELRNDLKNYGEALYHFLNFSYQKALIKLYTVKLDDKSLESRVNNLQIRCLYETNDFVRCVEKINLYKKQNRKNNFLSKKKIDKELAFLLLVENLIKVKENKGKFDAEFLKNKIEKDEFIPSKEWLIEKCYELYEKPKQISNY
ncbi:MAG: hypothetical protein JSS63_00290 [Bacteroidetes bacterium]|nr:hypothetical protein [Bacteroidota bacterium]